MPKPGGALVVLLALTSGCDGGDDGAKENYEKRCFTVTPDADAARTIDAQVSVQDPSC
jgi:hypothetical protein